MRKVLSIFLTVIISIVLPASAEERNVKMSNTIENSKYYGGVDLFSSDLSLGRTFGSTTLTTKTQSKGIRLKGGMKFDDGVRVQVYFSVEDIDNNIDDNFFSPDNIDDGNFVEIGSDLIKTFEMTKEFKPFILISLGLGSMNVSGYSKSRMKAVSLKGGFGVLYAFNDIFELQAGLDVKYRKWSDTKILKGEDVAVETFDSSTTSYLGLNIHF